MRFSSRWWPAVVSDRPCTGARGATSYKISTTGFPLGCRSSRGAHGAGEGMALPAGDPSKPVIMIALQGAARMIPAFPSRDHQLYLNGTGEGTTPVPRARRVHCYAAHGVPLQSFSPCLCSTLPRYAPCSHFSRCASSAWLRAAHHCRPLLRLPTGGTSYGTLSAQPSADRSTQPDGRVAPASCWAASSFHSPVGPRSLDIRSHWQKCLCSPSLLLTTPISCKDLVKRLLTD